MQIISGPHPGSTRALVEEDLWSHTKVMKLTFFLLREGHEQIHMFNKKKRHPAHINSLILLTTVR